MSIDRVAEGVWQLTGYPHSFVNCYLVGEVLMDCATRWAKSRLLRDLRGRRLSMIALTHCHPDHQGLAKLLCETRGIPLACHEADVPAMEGRGPMQPNNWILRLGKRCWSGPPCPVGRVLRHGDEIAGFRIVHAPGHTPGHVMYFRDSDRVALAGDVLANLNFLTMQEQLVEPPRIFCSDPAENRRSIAKLAELEPSLVCFGHGPPLHDTARLRGLVRRWT